jgi:hypothetical protein
MTRQVFILLSVLTGFFLMPKLTYACGANSDKVETVCCKEGRVCDQDDKSCCADHHSKNRADDDCGGQCNHGSCHCPSVTAPALPDGEGIKRPIFIPQKQRYYLADFVLSSGFHSIWLPPKIS